MEIISRYFRDLSDVQVQMFNDLAVRITGWNDKINLVSRKDIQNLELHHVLHSLAIARYIRFTPGSKVLDLGTGGGFPGLPLAILFPEVDFTLIDARNKKINVVNDVAGAIGLENVRAQHVRVEDLKGKYDFVVTRAVASLDVLYKWSRRLISEKHINPIPNGLIALKGGEVHREVKLLPRGSYVDVERVSGYFSEPYFEEKYVVYVQG